jgi:hypothetical protein
MLGNAGLKLHALSMTSPAHAEKRYARLNWHSTMQAGRLMVRFDIILSATIGFAVAFVQTGCAHSKTVWSYYDQCALENTCSPEGTAFTEYVDSLALSVKNKKLTDVEAMRRYTEYKSGGASTCTRVGNAVNC